MRIEAIKPIDYDELIGGVKNPKGKEPEQPKPEPKPEPVKFGMHYERAVKHLSELTNRVTDVVELSNGKKLTIMKEYFEGKPTNKLAYLTDNAGNWLKSKLTFYNGRAKRIFERIGEAK